ncbi:hypothetical protein K466DRAFT_581328 [Polyporus arcularius HHB13444]|uniref:Uncharacterized protein n=1 Tax=Polyporus arcularius HHB13444 TaxID=1314778 RepID=A0A5C3Q3H5_9APHY|nr:hypothetical protein K466DRAFT_581328 [Polyporus arcularius HHB13444]
MDNEIEETHRQLRRSAALIQDAYQGLSTLHTRVSEASSIRAQSASSLAPLPRAPFTPQSTTAGPVDEHTRRSTMDPGHDVIVISSDSELTPSPSTSASPPSSSPATGTSPRRSGTRSSDPTLASLRTELLASTQSVRDRAMEFDDLRRSILQYSQERNTSPAEGAFPPGTDTASRAQESHPPASRRMQLENSLRQRAAAESATSLGMMVAARSRSPPSNIGAPSPNASASSFSAPFPSAAPIAASSSSPSARIPGAPIPSSIASRVTRLAQEIQQDIARITQQSESLMAWINEHRARLDAASAARSSRTATSDIATIRAVHMSTTHPSPTESLVPALSVSAVPQPPAATRRETGETTRAREQVRRLREQAVEGGSTPQAIPIQSRRSPDGVVRARYLRQSVSANFSTNFPSSSPREEPSSSWRSSGSFSTPAIAFPSMSPSTTITADAATSTGSYGDPEVVQSIDRVRAALARARVLRRGLEADDTDMERSPSYMVRRHLNADGEEEVVHITMGSESSNGLSETAERPRDETDETEEDDEYANEAWLQALSRLDAMSRQTAARDAAPRSARNAPSTSGWDLPPMTRGGTRLGTTNPRTYSTGPYAINLPQRDARRWRDEPPPSEDAEAEYERDIATMRARARSLISSAASARTLSGTTLPPPPPANYVRPTLFPTTSTQGSGSPSSLWNDTSARSVFSRYQALFRETDPERGSHTQASLGVSSPSSPPERARRHRTVEARGANLEQPMWGSPTPFYPSPLPLPLVQHVGSLAVRSQAFAVPKVLARIPRRRGIAQAGC